jgi:hypothetical protein
MAAMGADALFLDQVFGKDHLLAGGALVPEIIGNLSLA